MIDRQTLTSSVPAPQPRQSKPLASAKRTSELSSREGTSNDARGALAVTTSSGLQLPHERDESVDATADAPDPVMVQAKRDIDAGLVDTDMRATPGLDAALRAKLVPGAGGKPPGAAPMTAAGARKSSSMG